MTFIGKFTIFVRKLNKLNMNQELREMQLLELQKISKLFCEKMESFRAYQRYPLHKVRLILKKQSEILFLVLAGEERTEEIEELKQIVESLIF